MFDQCIYFNSTALARRVERDWADVFAPFGLTPSQAFMLRAVLSRPGLLQGELAEALVISRPTATRALNGLAERGLIERRSAPHDGREQMIFPSTAALAIKDALNAAGGDMTARLKKKLGAGVFDETVSALREVRGALG